MDTPQNPLSPEQRPSVTPPPEGLVAPVVPENASTPEAAPAPSAAPGEPAAAVTSSQPVAQLSADDVAAAIAAAPTTPMAVPGVPDAATDQDVIEPEWVDHAEKVIAQTAGNPYAEEEAVEDLQIDYLKKRYGYEVKKPDDKAA